MSWDWEKADVKPLSLLPKAYQDLDLRVSEVSLRGPTEAVFLARLWDLMLCMASQQRQHRASARSTSWTPPYVRPSDASIHRVFEETRRSVRPDLLARLWAPVTDPETGALRQNLGMVLNFVTRKHFVRLPHQALELWKKKMDPSWRSFLPPFRRRDVNPRDVGVLPGLRIHMPHEPLVRVLDPQSRVHCPHGPAIVHADGTPEFFWRGTRVPSYFIPITDHWREQHRCELQPLTRPYEPMTAESALSHRNTEVRRAACEIVGWHKILEDLNAVVINKNKDPTIGELLRVVLPNPEDPWGGIPQQFLRVRCGTGRVFALAVPNECNTALEANAWTYGLDPRDYKPEVRT
jgi:hypothetical protein